MSGTSSTCLEAFCIISAALRASPRAYASTASLISRRAWKKRQFQKIENKTTTTMPAKKTLIHGGIILLLTVTRHSSHTGNDPSLESSRLPKSFPQEAQIVGS